MITSNELITKINEGEFDIIILAHNCFNYYRKGILTDLVEKYPQVKEADKNMDSSPNSKKLGHFSVANCTNEKGEEFLIINAYVQYFYGKINIVCESNNTTWRDRSPVQYDAIYNAFSLIAKKYTNKRVAVLGFPGVKIEAAKALINVAFANSGNTITYINFDEKEKKRLKESK